MALNRWRSPRAALDQKRFDQSQGSGLEGNISGMDFVCKLDENNYLPKCRNDFEPVMMGYDEVCLRMYTSKKPFTEAEKLCERDGANLVHIKNEQEQTAFNQV